MITVRLRDDFARFVQGHGSDAPSAIRRVAMIGALVKDGVCSKHDEVYLAASLRMMMGKGLPFARQLDVAVYNRAYDEVAGDFLQARIEADAVVFAFLYWTSKDRSHDFSTRGQSPFAGHQSLWHRKLIDTGAKVAVNVIQNVYELPTFYVARAPFRVVAEGKIAVGPHDRKLYLMARRDWMPSAKL